MPLFMLSMERNEAHYSQLSRALNAKSKLKKNMDHPNASDARDFFTPANIAPEHPVNRNNSNLTLVSWNANGIRTRVDEFREFISEWNQTSLTFKKHTSNPVITLPFLTTISTGLTAPAVAAELQFLIKRSIPHHEIVINNPSFETTAIKIERTNLQPITVISAYRSPRKPILIQDLHQLFRNQDYVLVAGDLNAKHASWSQ
ncbi:hypothetical protein TNCV_4950891 [Trichonephila clavipes]|nr:hypothetical protein TNCV_4950891 [Trichonephila clavipes]